MRYLVASSATFGRDPHQKFAFVLLMRIDAVLSLMAASLGFDEVNPYFESLLGNIPLLILLKLVVPVFVAWLVPGKLLLPSVTFMVFVLSWNLTQLSASIV